MAFIPTSVVSIWLSGLLSVGIIAGGIALLRAWYERAWVFDPVLDQTVFQPDIGANGQTALLVAGLALLVWSLAGGLLVGLIGRILRPSQPGRHPNHDRNGQIHRIAGPDGTELQVETYGSENAQPIILIHGWGTDSTEWYYQKRQLSEYRVIVWDLPGVQQSSRSASDDYSLENFARNLAAVLEFAGDQRAIIVGHSIGGMTILTFCRMFPELLGSRVAGLVLVHTTYINPVRTTLGASVFTPLERPLLVPLLHLMIWLSPLVRVMNWMSYLNGSSHISTALSGYAGTETWDEVAFSSSFGLYLSPAVLAKGMFGMLHYNATATLPTITCPVLIVPANRDPVCKPEASDRIHADIPTSQLSPLAPAKHMGIVEHNEEFSRLVRAFAAACTPTDRARQPLAEQTLGSQGIA